MKLAPLLVYMTCLAACATAQTGLKEAAPPPKLELAVHPEDIRDGLPFIFTVTLRNMTDHDIRIPNPSLKCIFPSSGGMILSMIYAAAGPPHGLAAGCGGGMSDLPDMFTQAKNWLTLASGEVMLFHLRSEVNKEDIHPGIYRFWVTYWPPRLNSEVEARQFAAAKIDYPKQKLESAPLDYEVH